MAASHRLCGNSGTLLYFTVFQSLISPVSECIILEFIWIKRTFSLHSYSCFYVCIACALKNRQLIFYRRYFPFVQCWSCGPRHEQKQSVCLSAWWQSYTHCTQQYVVSLDRKLNANSSGVNAMVFYKHLWSLECILVGNSQQWTYQSFHPCSREQACPPP